MNTKKYILKDKDVGFLASTIAMQEGKVSFEKDSESSFYIATVEGDEIHIPEKLQALEMLIPEISHKEESVQEGIDPLEEAMKEIAKTADPNTTDLVLRLHLNQNVDPEKFPLLYEEIAKAVNSAMKKMDDE